MQNSMRCLLAALVLLCSTHVRGAVSDDLWLAIEDGWIWKLVHEQTDLAGSWYLPNHLQSGVTYRMTFDVASVEGTIGLFLGDHPFIAIREPGSYSYDFTADDKKRMVFRAVWLKSGRAKLDAKRIRVKALSSGGGDGGGTSTPDSGSPLRIAYSSDGNQHDADDWAASPLVLAMLADERQRAELVHFDYNNHLGNNDWTKSTTHGAIVDEAVRRYGLDPARVFDDQTELEAAVSHLAAAINASSDQSRLYLICAGPMEVCWRGINRAMDSNERYVTVISHSWWNDYHRDTAQLVHSIDDIIADFDVEVVKIPDQNDTAFRSPVEDWMWLQQHGANGQWLYERITATGRSGHPGDASDAGMLYFVLKGLTEAATRATMSDVRAVFND